MKLDEYQVGDEVEITYPKPRLAYRPQPKPTPVEQPAATDEIIIVKAHQLVRAFGDDDQYIEALGHNVVEMYNRGTKLKAVSSRLANYTNCMDLLEVALGDQRNVIHDLKELVGAQELEIARLKRGTKR